MLDVELYSPIELFPGESDDELYRLTVAALAEPESPGGPRHLIPDDLEDMPPGPYLAAILCSLDLPRLTGAEVISVLRAQHRQTSHHQAGTYAAMAEAAHCVSADSSERSTLVDEYAGEEIGAALSYTRRKADYELSVALDLRDRHPEIQSSLAAGQIDARKAALLDLETRHLEHAKAREVVGRLLDAAPDLTTGQLRARLQRLAIEVDPEEARQRMEQSLAERRVVAEPNAEGTAALIISECSPDEVYAARDHINRLARRLQAMDEPRTIDQLRADVALALLTGRMEPDSTAAGSVNL